MSINFPDFRYFELQNAEIIQDIAVGLDQLRDFCRPMQKSWKNAVFFEFFAENPDFQGFPRQIWDILRIFSKKLGFRTKIRRSSRISWEIGGKSLKISWKSIFSSKK